jgi:hypothetical protein
LQRKRASSRPVPCVRYLAPCSLNRTAWTVKLELYFLTSSSLGNYDLLLYRCQESPFQE